MNETNETKPKLRSGRTKWIVGVAALIGCLGTLAYAAFGPGQIPTVLAVNGATVRAGQWTTTKARLTRVDNGRPLQGEAINFWIGDPTYPSSRIGTRMITDVNGVASVRIYGDRSWVGKSVVILAEYEPRWPYATPLPWNRVVVSR